MGYYMTQVNWDFFIHADSMDALFLTLKALPASHGHWVSQTDIDNAGNVTELLDAWRWTPYFDPEGNIERIEFAGEKSGGEDVLFDTIAPYVRDYSFIEMQGEEPDARWRWVFKHGRVHEYTPIVIWPDEQEREEEQRQFLAAKERESEDVK